MSDLFGLNTVNPAPSAPRPERTFAAPVIATSTGNAAGDNPARRDADPAPERHRPCLRPHPGPPPAFETSLLEMDADLLTAIRRMQAERDRSRDLAAINPQDGAIARTTGSYARADDPVVTPDWL